MDDLQRYLFDRQGFLRIPGILSPDEVATLAAAVDRLHDRVERGFDSWPERRGWRKCVGRFDAESGVYVYGKTGYGNTWVIEDMWNADPAFLLLLGHAPTLDIVSATVRGRVNVNNSEVRVRFPGNSTGAHMGGPIDGKYAYRYDHRGFDCMMTRMIYFLHDVGPDDGPFSVVPGTHKSAFPPPSSPRPEDEPGAVAVTARAGDGVYFTEALRHGGFENRSARPRRTIHVGYGPAWMRAQLVGTMDEPQFILPRTWDSMRPDQQALFSPWPEELRPAKASGRALSLMAG
ncbi:hypothetical protein LBMAG53_07750 [Planctomycetota bacterium]|nr:hypothetical protein LBMAG53_07750 [Planctomycetota bacterium]